MKLEFSLTEARSNVERAAPAVEISLLLQKVEQPLERLEKGGSEWID